MGWLKRRREKRESIERASANVMLAEALEKMMGANTQQMLGSVEVMGRIQDLAAKKAAQILGSRGGRERARRAKIKKKAVVTTASSCPLCDDPMARGASFDQILDHNMRHAAQVSLPAPPEAPPDDSDQVGPFDVH